MQEPAPIDVGHQLAGVEIAQNLGLLLRRDRERAAAAGAAPVEAQDQARSLARAAMDPGIDAEAAVVAVQPGIEHLLMLEAGPPHQRAVGEHPDPGVGRGQALRG